MIPAFTLSGALPPFHGTSDPTASGGRSPYEVSPEELVAAFATSPERTALLAGLFSYRQTLRALGIDKGFHWIDGSFVEDAESTKGRPPNDIDLVTFAYRPAAAQSMQDWRQFVAGNQAIFDRSAVVGLDSYYVDMDTDPRLVIHQTAYWFGLFSHQRVTGLWKGMLQLDLAADDTPALASLGGNP